MGLDAVNSLNNSLHNFISSIRMSSRKHQAESDLPEATDPEILPRPTRYAQMLIDADRMPWMYNVIASAAQWILLAGYLVIPGTFTSLQKSGAVEERFVNEAILSTIQNPPLLAIACVFFIIGAAVLAWLYWEWRENYIWLVGRIFMYVAILLYSSPTNLK